MLFWKEITFFSSRLTVKQYSKWVKVPLICKAFPASALPLITCFYLSSSLSRKKVCWHEITEVRDFQTDGRQQAFLFNCLLNAEKCHSSSVLAFLDLLLSLGSEVKKFQAHFPFSIYSMLLFDVL